MKKIATPFHIFSLRCCQSIQSPQPCYNKFESHIMAMDLSYWKKISKCDIIRGKFPLKIIRSIEMNSYIPNSHPFSKAPIWLSLTPNPNLFNALRDSNREGWRGYLLRSPKTTCPPVTHCHIIHPDL